MSIRVELWELPGPFWRLPIRVVWHAELAEVRVGAGANLTSKMRAEAERKLLTVATLKGTTFWLSKSKLLGIAKLSQSEDPEEVIEWLPSRAQAEVKSDYQAIDFIKAYCGEHYAMIRDPLLAEAVWFSFCRFMMHWLLNENKTVDLVFAKLNAFVLRANWASVAAKYEKQMFRQGKMFRDQLYNPDQQSIVDRGVAEYLITSPVSGVRDKIPIITLDCQVTDKWRDFVVRLEQHRKSFRNGWSYPWMLAHRMKLQLPRVIEAYASFLKEARTPPFLVPKVIRDRVTGQRRGTPFSLSPQRVDHPCAIDVVLHPDTPQSTVESLEETDASVPEVSDLRPGEKDVR